MLFKILYIKINSEVEATITTPVLSIKNALKGKITLPAVNEIIKDNDNANAQINIISRTSDI
ncbi:MAG: DUF3737 family protein [Acetobacter sp.]|nr:DUF3737 family protein [Bacteroides sp.]MCM1341102.1 DUF3737 family protein [Acetobacter sp.]MCM1433565.1 DUF3737 family protein [Clostridiales bacterium]